MRHDPRLHAAAVDAAPGLAGLGLDLALGLLDGSADPTTLIAGWQQRVEVELRAAIDGALADMRARHGVLEGPEPVIVALDHPDGDIAAAPADHRLLYLFTGDTGLPSDGPAPLDARAWHAEAARRIATALAIDALPVQQLDRFADEGSAAVDRLLALAGARPLHGSVEARVAVRTVIARHLDAGREPSALLTALLAFRRETRRARPARGPHDVVRVRGGLFDLRCAVGFHLLGHGIGRDPDLPTAVRAQAAAGLIDPLAIEATDLLGRLRILFGLLAPDGATPAPERRPAIAAACGFDHWDALEAAYGMARVVAMESWQTAVAAAHPFACPPSTVEVDRRLVQKPARTQGDRRCSRKVTRPPT